MSTPTQRGYFNRLTFALCGLSWLLCAGCQPSAGPDLEAVRQKVLTEQLPSDIQSLADALVDFQDGSEVRVVGRIFADQLDPFDRESAAFNLIELPKPGHDHENPGDCPFCKREMENAATAVAQVVDDSGEILATSADQLLGLEKNQDIVVEGQATKVGEVLIINATSVHILADDDALDLAKRVHAQVES